MVLPTRGQGGPSFNTPHEDSFGGEAFQGGRYRGSVQAVVLAGGVGSRLRPWTDTVPKPLLPMLDRTLLEQVVWGMPTGVVDEIVVAGGYRVQQITDHFAAQEHGIDVIIVEESEPLGTGGALANCKDVISGRFACFNGDVITSLRMEDLLDLHNVNGGVGTLALWEVEDPTRFGIVGLDDEQRVTAFKEKPTPEEVFSNLINAGSYLLEEEVFDVMPTGRHSLERDVFPLLAERGQECRSKATSSTRARPPLGAMASKRASNTADFPEATWWTARGALSQVHRWAYVITPRCLAATSRRRAPPWSDRRCSTASASAKAPASTTSWPAKAPSSEKGASCVMWCLDPVPWSRTANASPANDGLPRDGEAAKPRDRLVHS